MQIPIVTLLQRLFRNASEGIFVEAFRFIVVGLIAFAADFTLLMVAANVWGWNYLVSAALAYTLGTVLNYLMSICWVFSQRRLQDRKSEFLVFALIGVTGLALTELVLWTGKDLIGVSLPLAKLASLFAVAVWNFSLRKILLFSSGASARATTTEMPVSSQ
jgi:putative flippase GtrA